MSTVKLHLSHWYVMEMHSNVEIILDHSFLCHYSLVEATSSWTDHHPLIKSNKKEKIELLLVVTAEDFNELYLVIANTCTFVIGYHPHTNQNTKATKMWQHKWFNEKITSIFLSRATFGNGKNCLVCKQKHWQKIHQMFRCNSDNLLLRSGATKKYTLWAIHEIFFKDILIFFK